MKNRSYYDGVFYVDVTTGNKYVPKCQCEICKSRSQLTVHHYLKQQKCMRDLKSKKVRFPNMWTEDFIKEHQKLFTLCVNCHQDVDFMSDERFYNKYGISRSKFIYKEV